MTQPETPRYRVLEWLQEEVDVLKRELADAAVQDRIDEFARTLNLPPNIALAAIYRASRRSGLTLREVIEELNRELAVRQGTA